MKEHNEESTYIIYRVNGTDLIETVEINKTELEQSLIDFETIVNMKIKQQIKNTIKEYPKYNKANITYSYTILEQYHFEKRDENGNTQRVIDFVKDGYRFW